MNVLRALSNILLPVSCTFVLLLTGACSHGPVVEWGKSDTESTTSWSTDTGANTDSSSTSSDDSAPDDSDTPSTTDADTDTASDDDTATDTETSSETATEGQTDTQTDTDTGRDTETGTTDGSDTGDDTSNDTETSSDSDTVVDSDTATDSESDTDSDTHSDTDPDADCILYVRQGMTNYAGHDGSQWSVAFEHIQDAIDGARADIPCEIWVAKGTYLPTLQLDAADERSKTFMLKKLSVSLYGGFSGYETVRDDRRVKENITVLSGDLAGNDDDSDADTLSDNTYHVVTAVSSAFISGFTIQGGNADNVDSNDPQQSGASGGGLYSAGMAPVIEQCRFINNSAESRGGALYLTSGTGGRISRCSFENNTATGGNGGALALTAQNSVYIGHSLFKGNSSAGPGGAAFIVDSEGVTVTNSIFTDNRGAVGGALFVYTDAHNFHMDANTLYSNSVRSTSSGTVHLGTIDGAILTNNLFYKNDEPEILSSATTPLFRNNLLQTPCTIFVGADCDNSNIVNLNPRFTDAENGDFSLATNSRCIDAGDASVGAADSVDLDGDSNIEESIPLDYLMGYRVIDGDGDNVAVQDMGAMEYQPGFK